KTSIFSHPVYLFLREFSLQDFRGGSSDPLPVSEYAYHIVFGHHQYPGCQKTIFKRQGSDIDIFSGIFTINNRP
ncbi:hypothetical protein, partial [Escherichia coli]|uniref:hypothetical protein n=1 Tax=Escherichia coli TaxID=562 RepID=UPI001FF539BE